MSTGVDDGIGVCYVLKLYRMMLENDREHTHKHRALARSLSLSLSLSG